MKVFVAGATGVIGRRLVPMLVEKGHEVAGMTRSQGKASALHAMGAEPVVCDVFDADALQRAVEAVRPEAIIHQLTDLPSNLDPRKIEEQAAGNDRIRTEGTRNLVAAAVGAGTRRIVAQSIAFVYAPVGERVKGEEAALFDAAPWPWSRSVEAVRDLEDTVTATEGIEGLALRYGFFYGPGSTYAPGGYLAREVGRRRFPVVGRGTGVFSFVHVDDAAAAAVAALDRGASGIYNVTDDDPAPMSEWLPAYAEALGAKKPFRVPKLLARLVAGPYTAGMATELRGASNAKAKRELGWQPRWPSWRQGFQQALG